MGLKNVVLTVAGVGTVVLLFSIAIDVEHIRHRLEGETAASAKVTEKSTPKEPKSKVPSKDNHKD